MHTLSSKIALLAVLGAMAATSSAFAAPNNAPNNRGNGIDCSITANANNPFCVAQAKGKNGRHSNGSTNDNFGNNGSDNNSNGGLSTDNGQQQDQGRDHSHPNGSNGKGPNNPPGPPPQQQGDQGTGPGNWSRHDRDEFHQRFRSFDFGFFSTPTFGLQLGAKVPRSFDLRPVPRTVYRAYPRFRGYLYFETRHGDVVIVSPSSRRIVAII